jgi:HSP20 family protein
LLEEQKARCAEGYRTHFALFPAIPQIVKRFMREDVMKEMTIYENMFQDLFNFRRDFDQIFSRMLTVKPWTREEIHPWTEKGFAPAIETFVDKEGKKYFCRVSLPGVDPKDVEITVKGNFLTVKGERKFVRTVKEVELYEKEIAYGKFERMLELPEGVSAEKLQAEYVNGVMEITAPITAGLLPRKIEVKTSVPLTKQMAA